MNDFPDFSNYGYQVTRELGHNRAGGRVTYLATEINTKRSVVVKQFQFAQTGANWAEYQAYEKEIQILRALDNPNIPRYLDSFQTASGFCMVQEYKDANSLATSRQQTPQKTKQIAISVLEILKYLQNRMPPVIHRDLKPENILVDDRLNVSLVDFGFARIGGGEVAASSVVKGTLGFMPPEQMFNRQLTVASDLYSLGATLICLLIGINSTEVGSLMDETGRINFKHRLPQLTPEFLDWLQKMVEPNFKHRYASADAALNALIPLEVVQQREKSKFALISVGVLTAIAAIFIPLFWKSPEPQAVKPKLKPNEKILNSQTQVMLTNELESTITRDVWYLNQKNKVYFAVSATELPEGEYEGSCKVVNSQGKIAAESRAYLKTTGDRLNTWCWYNFNKDDKPGYWQFQFYLDGQKVAQNSFKVLP
ncbi:serine/threonine protein kinase [Lyngbya sp. CCAP 1446/10]|uniref:serine/threonine protein kinase n=1 Tax=Lyngbya sp. CCAP 1446/10 TaxID=439293 RepID=UPI0022389BC1|nr:serine/threonine-protein kinase [Lyngbya sp. CCAP 1446/10]MCW6051394.1 serine/threonine protein kinase [Lyngbya sp. CCAP 1446/10]